MPAMARAVGELLARSDVAPTLIVGHSAGAAIAIRMALDGIAAPARDRRARRGAAAVSRAWRDSCSRRWRGCCSSIRSRRTSSRGWRGRRARPRASWRAAPARGSMRRGCDCYERLFATPAHCAGAIAMMADWDLDALRARPAAARRRRCCWSTASATPRSRSRPRARRRRWSRDGDGWRRSPGSAISRTRSGPSEVAALIRGLRGRSDDEHAAISACSTWRSSACRRSPSASGSSSRSTARSRRTRREARDAERHQKARGIR